MEARVISYKIASFKDVDSWNSLECGRFAELLYRGLYRLDSPEPDRDRETAIRCAERALMLDPDKEHARIPAVCVERSFGSSTVAWSIAKPFADYTSLRHPEYYHSLMAVQQFDEAIEHGEANPLCDPFQLGQAHMLKGDYPVAED